MDVIKNICMITQSPYPTDPRVRRQAEKLEKEGYTVDILCVDTFQNQKFQTYGSINVYRILKYTRYADQLNYFVFSLKFFLLCCIKLQSLYREKKYSLIQVHNMPDYHIFIGFVQKIFFGVPLVLDIHDLTVELFKERWSGKKSKFFLPFIISCSFADHILTVTDECVNILVNRGVHKDKITLVLNSANEDLFVFNEKKEFKEIKENLKLFYHGTTSERFGLHTVIQALPQIENCIPGTQFTIYGKYDQLYKEKLLDMIKKLGLEGKVHLFSTVPIEQIIKILQSIDIGVVPYQASDYMHLSLSTKAFEYAAYGIPIISSRLKSMEKVFRSESISFFEPDNPEDLANKIIELCKNPELRKTSIFSAKEDIDKISWKVMGKKYFEIIYSLIKN
jgi:glycosyltransferase involved in cell wall biosynthesis